jgi:uncharacterized protein YajQ (UPF0234 family)
MDKRKIFDELRSGQFPDKVLDLTKECIIMKNKIKEAIKDIKRQQKRAFDFKDAQSSIEIIEKIEQIKKAAILEMQLEMLELISNRSYPGLAIQELKNTAYVNVRSTKEKDRLRATAAFGVLEELE